MHELIIPYQHCTVLHKIMHKIIAGLVCFYVDSVMLMQQSRRVYSYNIGWRCRSGLGCAVS